MMKGIGTEWLIEASGCDADALRNIPRLQSLFNCLIADDDPRVRIVNQDAMIWLERSDEAFDAAIIDFPDPNNFFLVIE